jgi:hypothetical protein
LLLWTMLLLIVVMVLLLLLLLLLLRGRLKGLRKEEGGCVT